MTIFCVLRFIIAVSPPTRFFITVLSSSNQRITLRQFTDDGLRLRNILL